MIAELNEEIGKTYESPKMVGSSEALNSGSSNQKINFKIVRFNEEERSKNPELFEMAKENICFDQFLQPKQSYLERVRQWTENEVIQGSPSFTLHMTKKEIVA